MSRPCASLVVCHRISQLPMQTYSFHSSNSVDSSGNATGLGPIRSKELISSYEVLGVNGTDVTVHENT